LEDDASDQIWVDLPRGLHLAARLFLDAAEDTTELLVGELVRSRQLDVEDLLLRGDECIELRNDLTELRGTALLGDEAHEIDNELVGAAGDLREHVGLDLRLDLGVLEQRAEVRGPGESVAELLQLAVDRVQAALLLRCLEDGARIDAVRNRYDRLPSSWVKSISASASSIRRCWSGPARDLRVIFSAARRLSFPTSSRI
jgi:hypothetical protein